MRLSQRIFVQLSFLIPKGFRRKMEQQIMYAGMKESVELFLGQVMILGLIFSILGFFVPFGIFGDFRKPYIFGAPLVFVAGIGLAYLYLFFKAEERTKAIENRLPDVFQMIAANLRAGMTPYKALKTLNKEQLGPLYEEVEAATSKALGTESFADNIMRISERVNSELLEKSLKLFTTTMRSGGKLAGLLEELASDISETHALRNELQTSTKTYTAFIMFTIIFGTPLLLAISINFVDMITKMQTKTATQTAGFGMGSLMGEVSISADFLRQISISMIFLTAIFASMLIGVIGDGNMKSGLKYAPAIFFACMVMFVIANYAVANYVIGLG
jgi:Flp pilus assembly protein TadB